MKKEKPIYDDTSIKLAITIFKIFVNIAIVGLVFQAVRWLAS
jgi:hypothetical protein